MAAKKRLNIPSKGAGPRKPVPLAVVQKTAVEDHIAHAVEKAQKGEVIYAADYLEERAEKSPQPIALKLLLAAAQLIDSTNPNRAKVMLERAIGIDPLFGPAHLGLAVVLSNLGEARASLEHLRDAVSLQISEEQRIFAALMLSKAGLQGPAIEIAKAAFTKLGKPLNQASNCLDIALQIADWNFADELIEILKRGHKDGRTKEANESTRVNMLWCDVEEVNLETVKNWSERAFREFTAKKRAIVENPAGRKLRIGYLSSDFRNHPTAWLVNGLFRHHDKDRFDIFLYDSGWDDGSEIRKEIISNFQKIFVVRNLSDKSASELIADHQLDILVELNGPTKANRMGILAHRPAPIQICYLGWPGSAGGRFVDYIIADEYILPSQQAKLYPEQVIWLSETYQINDHSSRTLNIKTKKSDYGFRDETLILGMFNTISKVRREVWAAWMDILKNCPGSILWILDPGEDARKNLALETERFGIDPSRLVVAPKIEQLAHLNRIQACDLILDPWPIGGHTSTADALYAGVPIIAMRGRTYASRVSGGLLRAAKCESLIAESPEHYVSIATAILCDPNLLKDVAGLIRGRSHHNLFNTADRTREIEAAFEYLVWERFFESPERL